MTGEEVSNRAAREDRPSSDYTAYSYLTPGEDFSAFKLAPEFGRVPPYVGEVTPDERARADTLLDRSIVISLHDHPIRLPDRVEEVPDYSRTGRQHTAFAGLAKSRMTVVFDNMMDGLAGAMGNAPWRWNDIITDLGMRQADIAHQHGVLVVRSVTDIERAHETGRVGILFGLEAATPIENDLDRLDVLYGLGIRQIGIAYSDANALGSGLNEPVDGGLTLFGNQAVTRMNKVGLAIDVSHSSDQTGIDVCRRSTKPTLMTHAGAKAVWNTPRMKSDDVLRAIAETGGVIGISAAPHTTLSVAHLEHSILSVMDHFEYILELVGIEHVAFGPDTLYGDHVGLHRTLGHLFPHFVNIPSAQVPEFPRVQYVDGLENPTENFTNICELLVHRGYSDDEIRAVLGGNVMRTLAEIWA